MKYFRLIQFLFSILLFCYSGHVDVWKYSLEINRVETMEPLLSGSRTRGQPYTPSGTIYNNFTMTPLDDYVSRPDSNYFWQELKTTFEVKEETHGYETPFATVYFLQLKSQKWLDETKVDPSIWTHYLVVTVPKIIEKTDFAFLYTSAGSNGHSNIPNENTTELLFAMTIAGINHFITGIIFQVPNNPLRFWDEKPKPTSRGADAAIA